MSQERFTRETLGTNPVTEVSKKFLRHKVVDSAIWLGDRIYDFGRIATIIPRMALHTMESIIGENESYGGNVGMGLIDGFARGIALGGAAILGTVGTTAIVLGLGANPIGWAAVGIGIALDILPAAYAGLNVFEGVTTTIDRFIESSDEIRMNRRFRDSDRQFRRQYGQ